MFEFSIGDIYTQGWALLNFEVIVFLFAGTIAGVLIGAMPGLTATMGVAVVTPLTYGMSTISSFALLLGVYCGGVYGGSITAIVANIPGTPSAIMTTLDGYPMSRRGEAGKAIGIATVSSFIGGVISVVILSFFAPMVANMALKFSGQEFFAIGFFGLTVIAYISTGSMARGFLSGFLGLLIGTIGADLISGFERFTYGSFYLLSGIELLPVLIGVFGFTEILCVLERGFTSIEVTKKTFDRVIPGKDDMKKILPTIFRSAPIGTIIGAIPAAGGVIAAIVAYGVEKRFSRNPEKFGTGAIEGIAAPETANNACTGGAMIPMLTLGVPGDAATAILIGALMMNGLTPGPTLFSRNMDVVSAIFILMLLANCVFLFYGLFGARYIAKVISVPMKILAPVIATLCIVGTFSLRNALFDVWVMLFFGILGYWFRKVEIPTPPLALGLVLGNLVEVEFRRGLILSRGNVFSFFTRPISGTFLLLSVLMLILPTILSAITKRKGAGRITE